MTEHQHTVSVKILDREYPVSCPADKITELQEAARILDERMRKTRDTSNIVGLDRVAIITALNLSHDLLSQKRQKTNYIDSMHERISALQQRIEQVMREETA